MGIILKRVFKIRVWSRTGIVWLRLSPVASHCQRDKDHSVSQQQMNDYKLLKKKPLTRNYWHYCKHHSPSGNWIQIILIHKGQIKITCEKENTNRFTISSTFSKKRTAVLHPRSPRSFCMTTFSAIITNLTVHRLHSYDCTSKVSTRILAPPPLRPHEHIDTRAQYYRLVTSAYACQRYLHLKLETLWNYSCYTVKDCKFFL